MPDLCSCCRMLDDGTCAVCGKQYDLDETELEQLLEALIKQLDLEGPSQRLHRWHGRLRPSQIKLS